MRPGLGVEDAVQEALAAAATQWPVQGMPDNPRGWLITVASRRLIGPYQLQAAAIAAVHAEAERADDTDWRPILGLYDLLGRLAPNPVVTLNRAVALAMVEGPDAGLKQVDTLADDDRVATHHRLDAVRGHLLELAGEAEAAQSAYRSAARRTTSLPKQRYLEGRAARLADKTRK